MKTKKTYFIWPSTKYIGGIRALFSFPSIKKIENKLQLMFPSGHPVLCSSGRSSLSLVLEIMKMNRSNTIGLFPYASHCVIDAVSRNSTPIFGKDVINADLRVVYHQWGYVQEKKIEFNSIEDCVDTLCMKGTILFPGGGSFEIWSLPKILGTTSGGVLWCKDEKTAIKIRNLRNKRKGGLFQWILRLLSNKSKKIYFYWNGAESNGGMLSRFQTGEILHAIDEWDNFVLDRLQKIEITWQFAVNWLPKPIDRLPSVIPINCKVNESEIISNGLSAGSRFFVTSWLNLENDLIKVIPIPIHKDINQNDLYNIIRKLSNKIKYMETQKLIYDSIDELNLDLEMSEQIEKNENTVIFGIDSALDSIGLVNFITIIEQKIEEETGRFITIADERAMSMENSPFKTVGTLKEYIELLINE